MNWHTFNAVRRVPREFEYQRSAQLITCVKILAFDVAWAAGFIGSDSKTSPRRSGGKKLLPTEEIHDSRILAESSVLNCAILLTSDQHLRSIDHEAMTLVLKRLDLTAPVIATPREIVRKFFR